MKHVTATLLVTQRVETTMRLKVHVPDNADRQDIFQAVVEAGEELLQNGVGVMELTNTQEGGWGAGRISRTITDAEIPTVGEPMHTGEGAASWEPDDIVEILSED